MPDDGERAKRFQQFSGKKEDWIMWADKFLARATIREYDGNFKNLSKEEKHANSLHKKTYNELILSSNEKISFGIVKSAMNQVHPNRKMQGKLGIS